MLLIDKFSSKFIDQPSMLQWLDDHEIEVDRFLEENFHEVSDQMHNKQKMVFEPMLGYLLVRDSMMQNYLKQQICIDYIKNNPLVASLIGRKGGGKSCFAGWMSDAMHEQGINVVWFEVNTNLPDYITQVTSWEEIPDGSFVVVDEAGVTYNARDALRSENKDVSKLLMVSRHHDLRIMFNYQALSLSDINIWRLSDAWLVKPLQLMDTANYEDKRTQLLIKYIIQMQPKSKEYATFTNGDDWIRFRHPKPEWWTENISKSYSRKSVLQIAEYIAQCYENGMRVKTIQDKVKARGWNFAKDEIELAATNPKRFAKAYKSE